MVSPESLGCDMSSCECGYWGREAHMNFIIRVLFIFVSFFFFVPQVIRVRLILIPH